MTLMFTCVFYLLYYLLWIWSDDYDARLYILFIGYPVAIRYPVVIIW